MPRKLIYFDRNVYNIIKNHLERRTADYDLIKRGIALGVIAVPGSITVLEEALPIYRSKSPKLFALEKQTYSEIMDWRVFIKYHAILLGDEIMASVNNTTFAPFTSAYKITPDLVFTTIRKESKGWLQVVSETEDQKNKYAEDLIDIRKEFEQKIEQLPKNEKDQLTFPWLWQTMAKNFAEHYAAKYEVRNLTEPQIDGLLNLRVLGSVIRYDLGYLYKKYKLREKITGSDSRDHHHAALSAVTDIFVTEDKQLAEILGLMPIPNYTVWSYKQFIKWLSNGMALWQAAGLQMPDSYYSRPWHK